ncbi:T9SS type A sorting domain-containing protein [uncultured Aquimarina sp.]|uniref:T9SS type A sorting domain-containing protein n=1 Tax=uncultured Aquimarina sp. TaxID=575652 RepID=UPI002619D079|nr:T9SS type A sorting domain-containing protein [uncultured Aquimarina sp.]
MKKLYFLFFTISLSICSFAQSTGDIAFVAYNADGDDDFAIVALADIAANTTIYFSDDELDGMAAFVDSNEGNIQWDTPNSVIAAGTIVVFTDTDSDGNASYGASLGTLTQVGSGTINLAGGGDSLLAYLGTDENTPTTFLAGIQYANSVGDLTGSGLTDGSTFITIATSGSPDGGQYSGSRNSETSFANYIPLIANPANWTTESSDGELILPINTNNFVESATGTPTISISGAISGLDYFENNGPSSEDTFTVSGTNLTSDITVTAPMNFEISTTTGTGFGSSATLTPTTGTVSTTTIYVRLAANLVSNSYMGDATASSAGATPQTVMLSGTVSPDDPQFTISGFIGDFSYFEGEGPSTEDSFNVEGLFLTGDITITAPANFEVSLTTGTGFGSSVSITPTMGTINNTEVFVRLITGLAPNSFTGDITVSTTGTTDQTISLTGIVYQTPVCANVGDIIITEIMQNPVSDGDDPNGEYFELYNTTSSPIDIASWTIKDDDGVNDLHVIANSLVIPANGYIVIGDPNGSIVLDYAYEARDVFLGNSTDGIIIECSSTVIDQVIWDNGATFPDPTGASMELSINDLNSIANDDGANWAEAVTAFGSGDLGTPGDVNDNASTLSVDDFDEKLENFNMFPNPTNTGFVNITTTSNSAITVSVFDMLGKQVISETLNNNLLNVSNLNTGIYLIRLDQTSGSVTKKLVIE